MVPQFRIQFRFSIHTLKLKSCIQKTTSMSFRILFVTVAGFAILGQVLCGLLNTVLTYKTDYTSDEMLRLIFRGVPLTFDRLFNGNDTYGSIKEEVTFW